MTNKTKGFTGAAALIAAAWVTGIVVTRNNDPEPYVFNGFAEAEQHLSFAFKDGTNDYLCDFYFNPDKTLTEITVTTNTVMVPTNRMDLQRVGDVLKWVRVPMSQPTQLVQTNESIWHPGIALVFLNGERIGTNISARCFVNPPVRYLKQLAKLARDAEGIK